jgi:hypothetical protein
MHMSENREKIGIPAGRDDSSASARQEWRRPEWRKLDMSETESSFHLNTDGGIFS